MGELSMSTITLRTKEIGLSKPIKIDKNYEKVQEFSEIEKDLNAIQLRTSKRKLEVLKKDYSAQIQEAKEKLEKVDDDKKLSLQNKLDILKTEQEIQNLEMSNAAIEDDNQFLDAAIEDISKLLGLTTAQKKTVKSSVNNPQSFGEYISYLGTRLHDGSDEDYDKAIEKYHLELKAKQAGKTKKENLSN